MGESAAIVKIAWRFSPACYAPIADMARSTELTDEELREAASEAGISPHELRKALAERSQGVPARPSTSLLTAPQRGITATRIEGRVACTQGEALTAVRSSIERQTGMRGHGQAGGDVDVVDDRHGLTYRIHSEGDGDGGALVRVDVDPSNGRGNQALMTTGVAGISLTVMLLGWLFSATVLLTGLGIGIGGGLLVIRHAARLRRSIRQAHAVSAQALVDVEEARPLTMLPPS